MLVDRADDLVDFLKTTFSATEIGRTALPNGRIANVRIKIGTSTFMASEADQENMKAMRSAYYVYVEDVDHTLEKAVSNGATKLFDRPTCLTATGKQELLTPLVISGGFQIG